MTTATQDDKVTKDTFTFQGERLEIPAAQGYELIAKYREAARALHEAKARAFEVEQEIMRLMGGHEHLVIDGQEFAHWRFVDSTSFDVKGMKDAGPEYLAIYNHFLVTKPTRRFKVEGTVGVD